jgi:hypothetical protein
MRGRHQGWVSVKRTRARKIIDQLAMKLLTFRIVGLFQAKVKNIIIRSRIMRNQSRGTALNLDRVVTVLGGDNVLGRAKELVQPQGFLLDGLFDVPK